MIYHNYFPKLIEIFKVYFNLKIRKVLVISDLHYELKERHGIDESIAWNWLLGIVDYRKPDLLLSCGDWGTATNEQEFEELLRRITVLTIYGNHENMTS